MQLPINQIMNGDALQHLKELPDESVNMVMTSPPYWALRDYGSSVETIWDSLAESVGVECKHQWIEYKQNARGGEGKDSIIGANQNSEANNRGHPTVSNFCIRCNAWKGQLGLEPSFDLYIKHLCDIFDETKRVLRDDGVIFVNLGDTYFGGGNNRGNNSPISDKQKGNRGAVGQVQMQWDKSYSAKSLCMIPSRFAIEMINRGWILRNVIIWYKPNAMPSSVKDRFTVDFEYLFFFSKKKEYYFETQYEEMLSNDYDKNRMSNGRKEYKGKWSGNKNAESYGSPRARTQRVNHRIQGAFVAGNPLGRNKRTVWEINTKPLPEAHFATYPEELCEIPIKAGCPKEGIVLDMFFGSGTTGLVALKQGKKFIGIELNPDYIEIAKKRLEPYISQSKLFVFDKLNAKEGKQ